MCWFADFIYQEGIVKAKKLGKAEEREQGISFMIDLMRFSNASDQKIEEVLSRYYHLSSEEAKQKREAFCQS